MRADICNSDDKETFQRFIEALRRLGAQHIELKTSFLGVDLYSVTIGDQELLVYTDSWCTDIEGPDDLVQRVLAEFGGGRVMET